LRLEFRITKKLHVLKVNIYRWEMSWSNYPFRGLGQSRFGSIPGQNQPLSDQTLDKRIILTFNRPE